MTLATSYAKALYALNTEEPSHTTAHLKNLRTALKRRGHEGLLPHIFTEYEKLALQEKRTAEFREIKPERERTRVLYELYRTLVASRSSNSSL